MDGISTIVSFADHSIVRPKNARIEAAANAKSRTHITSGNDQKGRLAILRDFYQREKLPNPLIFSSVDINSLGTQSEELARVSMHNANTSMEDLQHQLYRCSMADLVTVLKFTA